MARALRPGGALHVEDLFLLGDFDEREQDLLETQLYGMRLPTKEEYVAHLEAAGFVDVVFEEVTADWRKLTVARAARYRRQRSVHVETHGEAAVAGLQTFYRRSLPQGPKTLTLAPRASSSSSLSPSPPSPPPSQRGGGALPDG